MFTWRICCLNGNLSTLSQLQWQLLLGIAAVPIIFFGFPSFLYVFLWFSDIPETLNGRALDLFRLGLRVIVISARRARRPEPHRLCNGQLSLTSTARARLRSSHRASGFGADPHVMGRCGCAHLIRVQRAAFV